MIHAYDEMYLDTAMNNLGEAFDYVATHDAILYFEPGIYYTDKPIVLRGDATYRVVFEYGAIWTAPVSLL